MNKKDAPTKKAATSTSNPQQQQQNQQQTAANQVQNVDAQGRTTRTGKAFGNVTQVPLKTPADEQNRDEKGQVRGQVDQILPKKRQREDSNPRKRSVSRESKKSGRGNKDEQDKIELLPQAAKGGIKKQKVRATDEGDNDYELVDIKMEEIKQSNSKPNDAVSKSAKNETSSTATVPAKRGPKPKDEESKRAQKSAKTQQEQNQATGDVEYPHLQQQNQIMPDLKSLIYPPPKVEEEAAAQVKLEQELKQQQDHQEQIKIQKQKEQELQRQKEIQIKQEKLKLEEEKQEQKRQEQSFPPLSAPREEEEGGETSSDDDGDDDPDRKKQKRRSKNDVQGRDHKCTFCDKTYLSYPALYTHMKNKHAKGPDGQPLININSGRGRGRPKKNAQGVRFSHIEPTSDEFFKASDKSGGPIDPTFGFREVYTEIYIKRAKPIIQEKTLDESQGLGEGGADQTEERKNANLDEEDEEQNIDEDELQEGVEKKEKVLDNQITQKNDQEEEIKQESADQIQQQQEQTNQDQTYSAIPQNPQNDLTNQAGSNQLGPNGEKIKKKRGRKPKSFYIQQQLEQEKQAQEQLDKQKEEFQEAENEEEVKIRYDEFKQHPLFSKLSLYAEELKDYIEEKQKIKLQKQLDLLMQQQQEKKEKESNSLVMGEFKVGNIFQTQKIFQTTRTVQNRPQVTFATTNNQKNDSSRFEDAIEEKKQEQTSNLQTQLKQEQSIQQIKDEKQIQEEKAKQTQNFEDQEDSSVEGDEDLDHDHDEQQRLKDKEDELRKDDRLRKFLMMSEEEKDQLTCDEVFSLYLRDVSKRVNESFYKTCLRFVLLYRECLNEHGWLKRRDHYLKAGILHKDEILNRLKEQEEKEEKAQREEMERMEAEEEEMEMDDEDEESLNKSKKRKNIKTEEQNQTQLRTAGIKEKNAVLNSAIVKEEQTDSIAEKPIIKQEEDVEMINQTDEIKEQIDTTIKNNTDQNIEDHSKPIDEQNEGDDQSQKHDQVEDEEEEEDIYIPQAEYTAVCNADFAPLICNDFVSEFLDKEHGACQIDRAEAIDLTRNFCYWIASHGLTCAHIAING